MDEKRSIEIDPGAGFCFGVEKAIERAEHLLEQGGEIFSLGSMVHNHNEVVRLNRKGLKTISKADLPNVKGKTVLIRAHGEPPSTYSAASHNQVNIIDATCPIVIKLQERIRKQYEALDHDKEQIVIFGKEHHPETIGLLGQTNDTAVLITNPDDISAIDQGKTVYLYSQTTMDPDHYKMLEQKLIHSGIFVDGRDLKSNCTICAQMKKRKPGLKEFISDKDLVLFVSGKESSNGRMLFDFCKSVNSNSYMIHDIEDVDPGFIKGYFNIGISGATSTPDWQLDELKKYIEGFQD